MSILGRILRLNPMIDGVIAPPTRTPTPKPETTGPDIINIQDENRMIEEFLANRDEDEGEDLIINAGPPDPGDNQGNQGNQSNQGNQGNQGDQGDQGDDTTVADETFAENGRLIVYRVTRDSEGNIVSKIFQYDLGPDREPTPDPDPPPEAPGDPGEQFNAREFAKANYSFLGDELIEFFIDEYNANGGDVDEALRTMRGTQAYKDKFPGIFREDGTTLRFTTDTPELDYIKMKEDYFNALEDYNLNPSYFEDKITQLFENDVNPATFINRLETAYTSLFNQFDAVKQYYVENYPGQFPTTDDISDEAIFASFISEDVSADIISQRVKVSQIGGAFKEEDFSISAEQAQRLVSAGLSGTGAQQIAARAEARLPRLQRLARRFTGREDIFGLSEFIESEVFGEGVAEQVRERLEAEQATAFTREGGAAQTQAGVTGLVEQ